MNDDGKDKWIVSLVIVCTLVVALNAESTNSTDVNGNQVT
jgi:hypothetical protein